MNRFNDIHTRLMQSDTNIKYVGISEVTLLAKILSPSEQILTTIKGWCDRKLTLVVATTERVLLLGGATHEAVAITYDDLVMCQHAHKSLYSAVFFETSEERFVVKAWNRKHAKLMSSMVNRHKSYVLELEKPTKAIYTLPERLLQIAVKPVL